MRILSLSFFVGSLILLQFSQLTSGHVLTVSLGLILVVAVICYTRALYKPAGIVRVGLCGFCWAYWQAGQILAERVPSQWEGEAILVEGHVHGIPVYAEDSLRFVLDIQQAVLPETGQAIALGGKLRVGWYRHFPLGMQAGERWQLLLKAKQPNGFMNPGGFDYEQWLFSQRITGSAYVRKSPDNILLARDWTGAVDRVRQSILNAIQSQLSETPLKGIVAALAVAERQDISPEQWEVLRRTGTSHLVAISGLHIGLVAGFGVVLVAGIWWLFPSLYLRLPVRIAGAMTGAILAAGYALLAGLTLPTQRALAMVLIIMLGLLLRRTVPFTQTLALALLVVLIIDPLAALSAGFWLSFLSVLMIFLISQRSMQTGSKRLMLVIQLGLSLGMIPLTASLFGSVSLMSAPANLIAVPLVSLLVVPLVLLGVVVLPLSQWLAGECWRLAEWVLGWLFMLLEYLAGIDWAALNLPQTPLPWVIVAMLGFLLLIMPKGLPGRWLGLILLLPVFCWQPERPDEGAFRLTLLDVGQGLAAAVETRNHLLIYDAGPKPSESFDAGRLVVLPWLYAQAYRTVDTMVVSHADNDHSGGAVAVLTGVSVKRLLSGADGMLADYKAERCVAGAQWEWDGVTFAVLHPAVDYQHKKRNNRSCVLKVSSGEHSVLLSGDIERLAEFMLSRKLKGQLKADVLVVPHHGSKSSSSPAFLKRVEPELALVAAGYRNRFNHPHSSVVKRYRDWEIELLSTVESGAIFVDFPVGGERVVERYRPERRGFWNR